MIKNIFQTFLATEKLTTIDNGKLKKYALKLQSNHKAMNRSNYGGWQSAPLSQIPKEFPEIEKLKKIIAIKLNNLRKQMGIKKDSKLEVSTLWININSRGSFNRPHTHPYSIFSGTYYVDVNEKSGRITFMNPANTINHHIDEKHLEFSTPDIASSLMIRPVSSELIIFPSWLMHYVEPNLSGKNRISISFNSSFIEQFS